MALLFWDRQLLMPGDVKARARNQWEAWRIGPFNTTLIFARGRPQQIPDECPKRSSDEFSVCFCVSSGCLLEPTEVDVLPPLRTHDSETMRWSEGHVLRKLVLNWTRSSSRQIIWPSAGKPEV
jgi:hypothetical protein